MPPSLRRCPMKSFKLRKADLLLLAAALVFGAVLAAVLLLRSPGGTVQVRVAGAVTAGYPLDVDASYTITGANGGTNLLVIEDGAARIEEASCPDGVCVHTGRIRRNGQSIVCLPNQVVVEIVSDTENSSGVDMTAG